jgi:hypothetical protein
MAKMNGEKMSTIPVEFPIQLNRQQMKSILLESDFPTSWFLAKPGICGEFQHFSNINGI